MQLILLSEGSGKRLWPLSTNRTQCFETLHQMATDQLSLLDRFNPELKFRKLLLGSETPSSPTKRIEETSPRFPKYHIEWVG